MCQALCWVLEKTHPGPPCLYRFYGVVGEKEVSSKHKNECKLSSVLGTKRAPWYYKRRGRTCDSRGGWRRRGRQGPNHTPCCGPTKDLGLIRPIAPLSLSWILESPLFDQLKNASMLSSKIIASVVLFVCFTCLAHWRCSVFVKWGTLLFLSLQFLLAPHLPLSYPKVLPIGQLYHAGLTPQARWFMRGAPACPASSVSVFVPSPPSQYKVLNSKWR